MRNMDPSHSVSDNNIFPLNWVPWMYVDYQHMIPGTSTFKYKMNPDCIIRKFKAQYFVIGDSHNKMFPKPLETYSTVV